MGIRIKTDQRGVKVWRSDRYAKPSYAVQVSKKEGESWIREYQEVRFRSGVDVPNGTLVYINDAFPTLKTWVSDGQQHSRIIWMIMDFDYEGQKEKPQQSFMEMPEAPDSFSSIQDDIPF